MRQASQLIHVRRSGVVSHAAGLSQVKRGASQHGRRHVKSGVQGRMGSGESGKDTRGSVPAGPVQMVRALLTAIAAAAVLMGIVYVGLAALSAPTGWLSRYAENTLNETPARLAKWATPN
jgi:hypothetical protein